MKECNIKTWAIAERINATCLCRFLALFLGILLSNACYSWQKDAAQSALNEKNSDKWSVQDQENDIRLKTLREKFGNKPNVLLILADDIGWGEIGSYGGGKLRGAPTPNLDRIAEGGMRLLSNYAEPSCTPTRVALMTGRLPIRTGLNEVLFPGSSAGLVQEEVTIAEILSEAGYSTGMFGKWHLGDEDRYHPQHQGFDYAYFNLYNGAVWPWKENSTHYDNNNNRGVQGPPYFLDIPENYSQLFGTELRGILKATSSAKSKEVADLSLARFNKYDDELTDEVISFMKRAQRSDKPFFAYFASNTQQVFACPDVDSDGVDMANCQSRQLVQHDRNIGRLMHALESMGVRENTLVIWLSDNGPMGQFYPSAGFSWLRGHKGEVYEGGVRTPALVYWSGVIDAKQTPVDIVHVSDWFTTIARIAGAENSIPSDRIIDGVDQVSLLLNGEGYSRRNYLFHYRYGGHRQMSNKDRVPVLSAIRMDNIKYHMATGEIYNLLRDPVESHSLRKEYMWAFQPLRKFTRAHIEAMQKFPNRQPQ